MPPDKLGAFCLVNVPKLTHWLSILLEFIGFRVSSEWRAVSLSSVNSAQETTNIMLSLKSTEVKSAINRDVMIVSQQTYREKFLQIQIAMANDRWICKKSLYISRLWISKIKAVIVELVHAILFFRTLYKSVPWGWQRIRQYLRWKVKCHTWWYSSLCYCYSHSRLLFQGAREEIVAKIQRSSAI